MQSILGRSAKPEMLSKIVVPKKFYRRIDLKSQVINEIFGGVDMPGILPGSTVLFTGEPGAGKSTMALQLADLFQKAGLNVVYNAGEENIYMIKIRADRLKLTGAFMMTQYQNVDDLLTYCEATDVEVLIQDSIQQLSDGDLHGDRKLKSVVKKIQAYKDRTDMTVLEIGHSTKNGNFAGPQEIKHDVDVHAHLKLNKETGDRIFQLEKNRFGPAMIPYELSLSGAGLDLHEMKVVEPSDEEETENESKTEARRNEIKNIIKTKLLEGEKITGYCHDRFGIECSGGYWRGVLARASAELEREGHKIGETKLDGRTATYVVK